MIRKMTSLPAQVYGLTQKGRVAVGADADLCIFDSQRICDKADYKNCFAPNEGLQYVIVGGKIAVEDCTYTGIRAGKVLSNK